MIRRNDAWRIRSLPRKRLAPLPHAVRQSVAGQRKVEPFKSHQQPDLLQSTAPTPSSTAAESQDLLGDLASLDLAPSAHPFPPSYVSALAPPSQPAAGQGFDLLGDFGGKPAPACGVCALATRSNSMEPDGTPHSRLLGIRDARQTLNGRRKLKRLTRRTSIA